VDEREAVVNTTEEKEGVEESRIKGEDQRKEAKLKAKNGEEGQWKSKERKAKDRNSKQPN
jgi:hypothetical protein